MAWERSQDTRIREVWRQPRRVRNRRAYPTTVGQAEPSSVVIRNIRRCGSRGHLTGWAGALLAVASITVACSDEAPSADAPLPTTATSTDESEPTAAGALPYRDPALAIHLRVEDLLERMTLGEKIGQMTLVEKNSVAPSDIARLGLGGLLSGGGGSPRDNSPTGWATMVEEFQTAALESRLGIPLLYGVDAVHGHSNVVGAVIFPHNVGLGAADNPELMERIGRVTAAEMVATNIHWNFAPAVSVPRDIRWGRTYEGFAEDTDRVTRLATAYLRGLQGDSLSDRTSVLATPKHFVGDGGTSWGTSTTSDYRIDQGVTDIDETELRTVHLPPYAAAVDAGARSVMVSYSSWGGEKMHAQSYLLTDVLKDELGFTGFVVSDWEAIDQIDDDYGTSVVRSINAGVDMNMVPRAYHDFIDELTRAVEVGEMSIDRIDDAVRRILRVKFELGLFENPYGEPERIVNVGSDPHRALAREAVAQSQVLLRNQRSILPLDPSIGVLYVAGAAADDIGMQSGGWTISWQGGLGEVTEGTTILDGVRKAVHADTSVLFDRNGRFGDLAPGTEMVCLAVVGEFPYAEGFGDVAEPRLPESHLALVEHMRGQCDDLIVVVLSGRPVLISDHVEDWDAVVAAWLPGSEGDGVADVLFGTQPFTGTLPYTWPRDAAQLPEPGDDALFPYGFGLTGNG